VSNVQFSNAGTYSVLVSNSAGTATSGDAVLTVIASLAPGDRFWSADGTIAGGSGTWDNITPDHWGQSATGPFDLRWYNQNPDNATFVANQATPGAITVGSPITVNKITATNASGANYSFTGGGTITISGPDSEVSFAGTTGSSTINSMTMSCIVSGSAVTKTGGGRLNMNNTGNSVGRWIVKAGALTGDNANQIAGTGVPASLVTNYFTLDGGGLGFAVGTASSITVGANRGIYLGTNSGNKLGCQDTGKVIYNGPISGPGSVSFPTFGSWPGQLQGSAATFVFSNPSNNYEGGTTVGTGLLQCGTNEVIPDSTTLTITGSARCDVNGFTETVGNVIVNGSNARLQDTVGGGLLIATNYDMRQGGAQTAVLGGNATLTKTTASMVSLNATNTYTGDSILKNGTIGLNAVGRFGTGTGTLYLDGSEGTIAIELSDTRTEANTLTNPVVFTAATATIQSAAAVTNDIVFRHSGPWTNSGGTLYLWDTSASYSFDALLSGVFDFTGPIAIGPAANARLTSYNPQGSDQIYDGNISGAGALRRAASGAGGRTILTADNSYSGGTLVEAGTLLVNNSSGSGTGSGSVTVNGGVLGGTGSIAGNVVVSSGGSIAAGASAGNLAMQNGLDLSGGGTNVWELAALKDNATGTAGTDFDVLTLTGGELVLGGSSTLVLQFTGSASAPSSANPFWQAVRTWTIIAMNGGTNTTNLAIASIANGTYNAGTFTNSVDGSGNILLTFTPSVPAAPHITSHPQGRTNIVGTTATFSVLATGSDPLTYEWYRIDAPFTPIGGATNSTFTITNAQPANASDYFARVYNGLGNDTSQLAKLTVAPRPSIQQPTVSSGNVTLNWAAVPGTAYQVRYNTNLTTTNWFVLTNIVATGTTITVTDQPPVGALQRYYRLFIQ
jgi:autotransporter-associated beta strand protein